MDGTKLQADASSFQNYDVERLEKVIGQLDEQVAQMLAEAAGQDAAEDAAEQDRSDSWAAGAAEPHVTVGEA